MNNPIIYFGLYFGESFENCLAPRPFNLYASLVCSPFYGFKTKMQIHHFSFCAFVKMQPKTLQRKLNKAKNEHNYIPAKNSK